MMVVFQNKIIYMPGLPPNSRRERISDWSSSCGGLEWEEKRVVVRDGTDIALCVSSVSSAWGNNRAGGSEVYVLYFQGSASRLSFMQIADMLLGNASSLPPRLPDLSAVMRRLRNADTNTRYTLVAVSYRGYWTSRGSPSEPGINKDAQAALKWILKDHAAWRTEGSSRQPVIVYWGQSVGCGFATNLASSSKPCPSAIILETPFVSVRAMLEELYPQKWLPYRHLWPFLRNHLDNLGNMDTIAQSIEAGESPPQILILEAGKDELVPATHGERLYQKCREVSLPVSKVSVKGAYHNEAIVRMEGKAAVARAIERAAVLPSDKDASA